jgi:hypothetical protein
MATSLNSEIIRYNPSSLVNIFNNALIIEVTKKLSGLEAYTFREKV